MVISCHFLPAVKRTQIGSGCSVHFLRDQQHSKPGPSAPSQKMSRCSSHQKKTGRQLLHSTLPLNYITTKPPSSPLLTIPLQLYHPPTSAPLVLHSLGASQSPGMRQRLSLSTWISPERRSALRPFGRGPQQSDSRSLLLCPPSVQKKPLKSHFQAKARLKRPPGLSVV